MARVLIVDDVESVRTSLGSFAERDGHEVSLAGDAAEALGLLEEQPFDVVVTDIVLPRKSGVGLLGEIRAAQPDVQVIMITGEPEVGTASEAVRKGAFDYLSKPVPRQEFMYVVSAAAGKKALLDENRRLEEDNRQHREDLERLVEQRTEKLQASESRYRKLFSSIADPIFVFDRETGLVLDGNAAACDNYGYTIDELRTMTPEDLHPREEAESAAANIRDVENSSPNEYTHITKNGKRMSVEVHTAELEYGGKLAWISIVRDLSKRKRAEADAHKELKRAQQYLDVAGTVFLAMDEKGRVTLVNRRGCQLLGYEEAEILGKNWFEHFVPKAIREEISSVSKSLLGSEGAMAEYHENPVLTKSGKERLIAWHNVVLRDEQGQIIGHLSSGNDITEQRVAEENLRHSLEATIQAVAWIIEKRDPYTSGHQRRVAQLSVAIAHRLQLSKHQTEGIRVAATLHDTGKISVPAEILSKPSALTEMEYALLQEHPKVAHEILQTIAFPWPVAEIVLQHHERLDGSGYPRSLSGENILLEAKIMAVADVVEAMSSHRPYRPALGLDAALEEITTNRGRLYDEEVVDACVQLFAEGSFEFDETRS